MNCLSVVEQDQSDLVTSGATDHRVLVWRVERGGQACLLATLCLHSGPVTALATLFLPSSVLMVATTATDSTVCTTIVGLGEQGVQEVKEPSRRQELGGGLALALHLTSLPGQVLLVKYLDST